MISAENIELKIGDKKILNSVSLKIAKGEMVAICGPNGAGKSTILRIISGEHQPTKGVISFMDKELNDWKISELAVRRAVLNQESTLTFPFRVSEVVSFGRYPHTKSTNNDEIIKDCMKEVDILHLKDRTYTTLSGGEKQRVHLARILAQLEGEGSEKLLLLDEPTSALDLKHQENVLEMAKNIALRKNYAVLIILHDLNLASAYADRMVFMKNGDIIHDGQPQDVLTAQNIKEVFEIDTHILSHPDTNRPFLLLDRKQEKKKATGEFDE